MAARMAGRIKKSVTGATVIAAIVCFGTSVVAQQNQPRDVAQMPARLRSVARIAPPGEPGTQLVISGTVMAKDGTTPVSGVVVYAFHTDAAGYYRYGGISIENGENNPRLQGWAQTDANGHFEFTTIRPAPYPNRDVPAHVHIHAWGSGYPRQWFELEFEADPKLRGQHFADDTADYLYVVPLVPDSQGVERCAVVITMRPQSNFRRNGGISAK